MLPEPSLPEAGFEVALDGAQKTGAEILTRVHRHDRLAADAPDLVSDPGMREIDP